MNAFACCHFSERICFLDHLVPFCHLFDIPLITNNQELLLILENYYPPTKSIYTQDIEKSLEPYSALFYAQPSRLFPYGFDLCNHHLLQKKRSIFTYHGFSEKYTNDFWFERFVDEDLVLIHGSCMKNQLKKKGIWEKLKHPVICGNLRWQFYLKHQSFFEKKIQTILPPTSKKKILWVPSWNLGNFSSSSLPLSLIEKVISGLPHDFQLLIKLHPLQEIDIDWKKKYQEHPSVFFIENFPLIYPLLANADLLLADVSSVAYDFLVFNRPMFFFSTTTAPILHELGRVFNVTDVENLFSSIAEKEPPIYHKRRQIWVKKIFSPIKETKLKQSIYQALR